MMKTSNQVVSENPEGSNVWSSILQQVQEIDTKKLSPNKSLLVLGDNETGKTTLIAKMAGLETHTKGSGLEYNFIEIRDEYREDSTKLGAWILDGDMRHGRLLNFALTEENFENSCCLLVASMSQPWNIMKSLETWTSVLEKHIESLNMSAVKLNHCKQKLLFKFINYVSSADEAESKLISLNNSTTKCNLSSCDENLELTNQTMSSSEFDKFTLKRNLGIEIVVVITKTDQISLLEKDYDYTEETFDFIQQAIRKFCLEFGASLFYVSAKISKNCDLLHKYLSHRIYELPFKAAASVVQRDAIFVPAGWDNEKKISILYDNIRSANPDDDYNDFIVERVSNGPAQRDIEIETESEQDFLLRMQGDLGKQVEPQIPNAPSPVQQRQNLTINPIDTQPTGEGVLQNFFNSLLSKGRTIN